MFSLSLSLSLSLSYAVTYLFYLSLSLSQIELGYNPIGPEGAEALCEVLKFHGNVNALKLGWCQVIDSLNYAYLILEFVLWVFGGFFSSLYA